MQDYNLRTMTKFETLFLNFFYPRMNTDVVRLKQFVNHGSQLNFKSRDTFINLFLTTRFICSSQGKRHTIAPHEKHVDCSTSDRHFPYIRRFLEQSLFGNRSMRFTAQLQRIKSQLFPYFRSTQRRTGRQEVTQKKLRRDSAPCLPPIIESRWYAS